MSRVTDQNFAPLVSSPHWRLVYSLLGITSFTIASVWLNPLYLLIAVFSVVTVIWIVVRSPELFLVSFLLAGQLKEESTSLSSYSFFDYTLISATLILISVMFKLISHKKTEALHRVIEGSRVALPLFIFVLFAILSLQWSPSPNSGFDKIVRFAMLDIPFFYSTIILVDSLDSIKRVFVVYAIASSILVLYVFFDQVVFSSSAMIVSNRVGYGSLYNKAPAGYVRLCLYSLAALILCAHFVSNKAIKILVVVLAFIYINAILVTNERFGIVALIAGIFIYFFLKKQGSSRYWNAVFISLLMSMVIAVFIQMVPERFVSRHFDLFIGGMDSSGVRIRTDYLYPVAIDAFLDHVFWGSGIGGYSYYLLHLDVEAYPHNIILELASETGLIGLVSFFFGVFSIIVIAKRLYNLSRNGYESILVNMLITLVCILSLSSLMAGNINDHRYFWFTAGVVYSLYISCKMIEKTRTK